MAKITRAFAQRVSRAVLSIVATGIILGASIETASAEPIAEFYKGKQIKFIVRSPAGGSYDLYTRLLARHIGRHIPGNPNILPINMPGAGGIKATNYIAEVAPRDGTILTIVGQPTPVDQALNLNEGLTADLRTFNWIGNLSTSNQVLAIWHQSPIKTIEDAKKRETLIGASGAGDLSAWMPAVYNAYLDTKFKVILGYAGVHEVMLAVERQEVDGFGSQTYAGYSTTHYLNDKLLNIILQVGMTKLPELPNVPLLRDLGKNAEDTEVLEFFSRMVAVGRPVATTPGVPAERVKALRDAFNATLKDAAFVKEAAAQNTDISPMTGEELTKIVLGILDAPKNVLEKAKVSLQPK